MAEGKEETPSKIGTSSMWVPTCNMLHWLLFPKLAHQVRKVPQQGKKQSLPCPTSSWVIYPRKMSFEITVFHHHDSQTLEPKFQQCSNSVYFLTRKGVGQPPPRADETGDPGVCLAQGRQGMAKQRLHRLFGMVPTLPGELKSFLPTQARTQRGTQALQSSDRMSRQTV